MICSWLNIEKNIGSFFWEQANLVEDDFNIKICNFKEKRIKLKKLYKAFKVNKIKQLKTPNGIESYEIEYLKFDFLSEKFNTILLTKKIISFNKYLIKKGFNIDLIHAQSLFNAGIEAYYFNKTFNIPFIFTEHNQFTLKNKRKKEIKVLNKIFELPFPKLVVSHDKIRQFAANGIFSNFEVVGNYVNESLFYYDSTIKKNESFTIITIGAYDALKDQKTLLLALDKIDQLTTETIIFNWIGYNGWGQDKEYDVKQLISEFNYKNIVINLTPSLSREKISVELNKADLFLFSSISEGMPVSVLEALACGLPVCSTRCGGVDEIISKENGHIVQIKDYEEMADFSLRVINKNIIYDKKTISKSILKTFGKESFAKKIKKTYSTVIN